MSPLRPSDDSDVHIKPSCLVTFNCNKAINPSQVGLRNSIFHFYMIASASVPCPALVAGQVGMNHLDQRLFNTFTDSSERK